MVRIDPEQISIPPDGRPYAEQPAWRTDFPVDWPQDDLIARRDFTKFMVLTSFAFLAGQLWIVVQNFLRKREGKPPIRAIASLADVPVGEAITFGYPHPEDRCILVRPSESTLVAYNQECTHLACAVRPQLDQQRFHCPCHEGYFDLTTGRPLAGPPRRPLRRIQLSLRNGMIYATGVEARTI